MSDTELKPCPFCGGKAKFIQNKDCDKQVIGHMRCINCGISQNQHNFTESLAIHEWNRRVNQHE